MPDSSSGSRRRSRREIADAVEDSKSKLRAARTSWQSRASWAIWYETNPAVRSDPREKRAKVSGSSAACRHMSRYFGTSEMLENTAFAPLGEGH